MSTQLVVSSMVAGEELFAREIQWQKQTANIRLLVKDEELRRIRVQNLHIAAELDEAIEKWSEAADRADRAESTSQYWEHSANDMNEIVEHERDALKSKMRELETVKTEISSLHSISDDSRVLLAEKLALSRDLANVRPELDHLRTQVLSNETIFADKLALQRDLSACQIELEDSRRSLQRLQEKQKKTGEQDARRISEIQELKDDLVREKRTREKAEKLAEKGDNEQLEELKKELAKEKRGREIVEKTVARNDTESEEVADLKEDLATERRERAKADKFIAKSAANWETQKAVLEDKLEQFRTKLRTTRETLKETQAALEEAQQDAPSGPSRLQSRNTRKRNAAMMNPDAAIGTPGDAAPNKRNKRATSVLGEKSTFSITPFLNRTTSVAPESPKNAAEHDSDEPVPSIEVIITPSVQRPNSVSKSSTATRTKATPLAPASPGKANIKAPKPKVQARKKAAAPLTLEKVTEEWDSNEPMETEKADAENMLPTETESPGSTITAAADVNLKKPARMSLKPKSLHSFASFRDGSLPPQTLQKKKRKLFGGGPKTLFDDDEDGGGEAVALPVGKAMGISGGQRAFGAFGGGRGLGGLSLLGGSKKKGPLVVAKDGFMFSPLKKDRKVLAAASAVGDA